MRRRPRAAVRIVTHCARCSVVRGRYASRVVVAVLPVDGVRMHHELLVCSKCDRYHHASPTPLEAAALAIDASDPIERMRFYDEHLRDAGLLQRTATLFLGEAAVAAFREELAERREDDEDWHERWRERRRREEYADLYEAAGELVEPDDIPF